MIESPQPSSITIPQKTEFTPDAKISENRKTREKVADLLRILFSQKEWLQYRDGCTVCNIFFVQERKGLGGERFPIIKFRTMEEGAQNRFEDVIHTNGLDELGHIPDDPRVTPLGEILRTTKIDELPQVMQYITGLIFALRSRHLTLMGVRPKTDPLMEGYTADDEREILEIRPGLIGVTYALSPSASPEDCKPFNMEYIRRCRENGQWKTNLQYAPNVFLGVARRAFHSAPQVLLGIARKSFHQCKTKLSSFLETKEKTRLMPLRAPQEE